MDHHELHVDIELEGAPTSCPMCDAMAYYLAPDTYEAECPECGHNFPSK